MTEKEIADKAKKHYELMFDMFSKEIDESVKNSIIYDEECVFENSQNGHVPEMKMLKMTTTKAVWELSDDTNSHNVCALNFASYKFPGGSFLKCLDGKSPHFAQEEYVCADSTLANVISNDKFASDYDYNRKNLNDGLYDNWAIYSPGIMFTDTESDVKCNFITCAAPNAKTYFKNKYNNDSKTYEKALKSRLKFVLEIAEEKKQDVLILGAFGCGVFGNRPDMVAKEFKKLLSSGKYSFKIVVFAIPDDKNYNEFEKVIMGTDA